MRLLVILLLTISITESFCQVIEIYNYGKVENISSFTVTMGEDTLKLGETCICADTIVAMITFEYTHKRYQVMILSDPPEQYGVCPKGVEFQMPKSEFLKLVDIYMQGHKNLMIGSDEERITAAQEFSSRFLRIKKAFESFDVE